MPDTNLILDAIAREMHTGVLALDKDGRALYANPFLLNSFPIRGGALGLPVGAIIKNEALGATIDGFIKSRGGASEEIEINDSGRFFSARIVPLAGEADFSILVFLRDITEEKRVETIKKDFVANVSHELRTPLASIKGYSETLLDGGMDEPETLREFLRVIDRHATRMSRLIDDLLILSRLESHQMSIVPAPVDIKELVASTAAGFGKQSMDKGITITAAIPDDLPRAAGDRDRLEQVMVNLLDNAIKYTPPGGSVSITAALAADGCVTVDVADTGIGIPAEDMPRIFERFYRVDKARSRELGGTGLGLAIVKHIINAHNGRVWVESVPGKGSTFSISLKTWG
ncbi:MAG: PAS domain-containing sensor histidine kinase [Deltaproteobacteria bacterium]|nr:PAS domain-containing sensor histidine kinase [Deltaproteobacteria bacterium]